MTSPKFTQGWPGGNFLKNSRQEFRNQSANGVSPNLTPPINMRLLAPAAARRESGASRMILAAVTAGEHKLTSWDKNLLSPKPGGGINLHRTKADSRVRWKTSSGEPSAEMFTSSRRRR